MKILSTVFGLSSFLAIVGGNSMIPAVASADPSERPYVACNQYGECWRVHQRYAYGPDAPVNDISPDWYVAHQGDPQVQDWLADPDNDRGYYMQDGSWHEDPGARVLAVGAAAYRYRRGNRVYCNASNWLRSWRGGWRRDWWRHRASPPAQPQRRRTTSRSLAPVGAAASATHRGQLADTGELDRPVPSPTSGTSVCGRPLGCKRFFEGAWRAGPGASVCPAY